MITPNIPRPSMKTATLDTAIIGSLKSHNGIKGSIALDSAHRKAANMTAAIASSQSTRGAAQPYSVTQVRASSSGIRQAMSVATPSQSMDLVRLLDLKLGIMKIVANA